MEVKDYLIYRNEKTIAYSPWNGKIKLIDGIIRDTSNVKEVFMDNDEEKTIRVGRTIFVSLTENCNLACKYCYADQGTYGKKNINTIDVDGFLELYERLNSEKKYIDTLVFFGGEPLLAIQQMTRIAQNIRKEYGKNVQFSIITNGTLITKEVIDLFNEYEFSVNVSLDGDKDINDSMRVMKNGESCFDTICKKLSSIKYRRFRLYAEVTLNPYFYDDYCPGTITEFLRVFEELGFDGIEIGTADYKEAYGEKTYEKMKLFYKDLINNFFDKVENNEYVGVEFNWILRQVMNLVKSKKYASCSAGQGHIFISSKCEVYPCQFYYRCNVKEMNQHESFIMSEPIIKKHEILECQKCFCCFLCENWCPGANLCENGVEDKNIKSRCVATQTMVEECIVNLAFIYSSKKRWEKFAKNLKEMAKKRK